MDFAVLKHAGATRRGGLRLRCRSRILTVYSLLPFPNITVYSYIFAVDIAVLKTTHLNSPFSALNHRHNK